MGPISTHESVEVAVPVAQSSQKKLERLYPNYIRTAAAFAVVQMHAIGGYLYELNPETGITSEFIAADVYYSFLRWATPFFIMLSGSLMLQPSRTEPTSVFLKKRIGRVMIPFAFWTVIYMVYQYRGDIYFGKAISWKAIGEQIFFQDVYFHMWFIPMIVGMYLLTPIFRLWIRHAQRQDVEYFLGLCFVITALQHFFPSLIVVKSIGWLGYIGFYVLGYYLAAFPIRNKRWIYALALSMPILTAVVTWWASAQENTYVNTYFIYFSPNVVLMSFALFLFLRDYDWSVFSGRYPRINAAVSRFSKVSFGVYFIHALWLDVFKNGYMGLPLYANTFFGLPVSPWYGGLLQAVVVTLVSALTMIGLGKISWLKKYIM
ncbi:MAG: acyltransferase family protein [Lewinellaceae bacterium]|nr:acyltransferase family protein [Lewinellaceae bacterium]